MAKATDDHMANLIILYFRAVDKLLYSFSSKEDLYKVGHEINKIMVQHNLPLQIPFSTSQAHHYNFFLDHSEETVLGYKWIKSGDLIIPDIIISHGRPGAGKKGITLQQKPFSAESMTKRIMLSVVPQVYDPLSWFYDPFKVKLKIIFSQICIATPGKDKKSFDTPIMQHCPALAVASTDACNQLSAKDQILPLERYVIPEGHDL